MHSLRAGIAAVLLAALTVPFVHGQTPDATPCVILAEIEADPDATLGEREFVEVWNCGSHAIQLAGWKVRDAPTTSGAINTFTFPTWNLPPNGRVVVWGGGAADGRGPAWGNPTVWNNAGDGANLFDAAGNQVDWLGYGTTAPPPANMTGREGQAKPGHGQSLQLDGSTWIIAAPTPGTVLGAAVASLEVGVSNASPSLAFTAVPRSLRPGAAVTLGLEVHDPNGDNDIASWALLAGNLTIASGLVGGHIEQPLTAPRTGTTWALTLRASDASGLAASIEAAVALRFSDLLVEMPSAAPVQVAASTPGGEVLLQDAVTVRNLGDAPRVPRIDVSAFSGPGTFPAEGHLLVGWQNGTEMAWVPYTGPLMPLPQLGPDAAVALSFRVQLPTPLPAGTYGTSFAVVP